MKKLSVLLLVAVCLLNMGRAEAATRTSAPLGQLEQAAGSQSLELELVGQVGEPQSFMNNVVIRGNYIFADVAHRDLLGEYTYVFQAFEISDLAHLNPLSEVSIPYEAVQISVSGDYAYLAVRNHGLIIMNVADPAHLVEVGRYYIEFETEIYSVAIKEPYAYVVDLDSGMWSAGYLRILDISDPAHPTEVGSYYDEDPADAVVVDHYVYLTGGTSFHILDVANPALPTLVGTYNLPPADKDAVGENIYRVAYANQHAYLLTRVGECNSGNCNYSGWLRILDVSNPAQPTETGVINTDNSGLDFAVDGNYAYVAGTMNIQGQSDDLTIIDISDPYHPAKASSFVEPYSVLSVALAGTSAYLSTWYGLYVVDIHDPASPTPAGVYAEINPQNVAAAGDYAFLYQPWYGVRTMNCFDPSNPIETGSWWKWDIGEYSYSNDMVVVGNYGYIAIGSDNLSSYGGNGLYIFDLSDMTHPALAGIYPLDASQMVVSGDYLYLAAYEDGLQVLDISNPVSPTLAGSYDFGNEFRDIREVAVVPPYAYLLGTVGLDKGLYVIDISDPAHLNQVGSLAPLGDPVAVAAGNAYAYVVQSGSGDIDVVDISDPANPSQVDVLNFAVTGYGEAGIAIAGNYLYVNPAGKDLFVYDISDPANAVYQTAFSPAAGVAEFAISDINIYAVDAQTGMYILRPKISAEITSDQGGGLAFVDTQNLTTTVQVPGGAVTSTVTLSFEPTRPGSRSGGVYFTRHVFDLAITQDTQPLPDFAFALPITATISYSDKDLWSVADETGLTLMQWNGNGWVDASSLCATQPGDITLDAANNQIAVPICRSGRFVLAGPTNAVYLPLIR